MVILEGAYLIFLKVLFTHSWLLDDRTKKKLEREKNQYER